MDQVPAGLKAVGAAAAVGLGIAAIVGVAKALGEDEKKVTLYHYTSKEGADGISGSGVIRVSSSQNDMVFGKGVYLTSMTPSEQAEDILYNNYDDSRQSVVQNNWRKVEWVIEVALPEKEVRKISKGKAKGRNVYVYSKDLRLSKFKYKIYRNPNV